MSSVQTAATFAGIPAWIVGRLWSLVSGRRSGLLRISAFPRRLTMPLRRIELDPVELTPPIAADAVRNMGRVLGLTVWLVTDFDQSRAVLSDADHSNDVRSLMGDPAGSGRIGGLGFTDPPLHTTLRRILMPEFTGRRLAGLLPAIEQIVEDRLDALEAAGPVVDLVDLFAFPVPFAVICELLGLEPEDRERFRQLGHDRFDVNGGGGGMFGAMSESRDFLREAVRKQRAAPGPGIIGSMVRAHGAEMDDETFAGLADGVFTGGYETSASMLSLGVLALLRDPDAFALARDETAVDGVVDELLRYLSVVQIAFPRFARRDLELGGQQVKSGDILICSLARANRSDVFGPAPDRLDPSREGPTHLAFGYGMHRCIGAELARMQLRVAFRALARRFPEMALAVDPDELQFHDLSIVYGLKALPVRLTPEPVLDTALKTVLDTVLGTASGEDARR